MDLLLRIQMLFELPTARGHLPRKDDLFYRSNVDTCFAELGLCRNKENLKITCRFRLLATYGRRHCRFAIWSNAEGTPAEVRATFRSEAPAKQIR